jgi:trigger factor
MDSKKFIDSLRPQALKRIQSRLVLEAIVKAENISATDEELEKELADMAEKYNMEPDKLKEMIGDHEKEHMKEDIAIEKALNLVVAEAKEVKAKTKSKKDKEEE